MTDALSLVEKHRARGAFIDTNLLVLWLVGLLNPRRIESFKRTRDFLIEDFELLCRLISWLGQPLIATPHVLSQVSDLTDLSGQERDSIRELFRTRIETIQERYDSARDLSRSSFFRRFGLADASIAAVCERNVLAVTADVRLYFALQQHGLDAVNFNHLRALEW